MSGSEFRQIVLETVPEDRREAASRFLSACFSLPPATAENIASASPIVILSGLEAPCALAVLKALGTSLPEGVALRIDDDGRDSGLSRLQWPKPPRVFGRELAECAAPEPGQEIFCPHCGGGIRVARSGCSLLAEPAPSPDQDKKKTAPPLFPGAGSPPGGGRKLASLRSLQAGDSGFWRVNLPESPFADSGPPADGAPARERRPRPFSGSAAFMKPGAFAVAIGRTRDPQAVKMVSEILGISQDRAREHCLDFALPVARGVSLEEAQALKARFVRLGIKVRIAKPSGG